MKRTDPHASQDTPLDCRSPTGITVGLIDTMLTCLHLLKERDLSEPAVQDALKDWRAHEMLPVLLESDPTRLSINHRLTAILHELSSTLYSERPLTMNKLKITGYSANPSVGRVFKEAPSNTPEFNPFRGHHFVRARMVAEVSTRQEIQCAMMALQALIPRVSVGTSSYFELSQIHPEP